MSESDVITVQPTFKADLVDTNNVYVGAGIEETEEEKEEEKEEKNTRRIYSDPYCCCYLGENDFLFQYFCCRMISNWFVGCGHCTERCLERCGSCLCDCCGDSTDNVDGIIAQEPDSGCCAGDCCAGDCCGDDCCTGDCNCCDCDCGDCDCDCGDCSCDCSDCSCFG